MACRGAWSGMYYNYQDQEKLAKKPRKCLSLLLVFNEALTSNSATTKTNNFVWMISMQYKRSARAQPGEQTQNTQTNKQADRQN